MKQVTIPAQWLQELIALCGPEDHELRERVMKSAAPAPVDALATGGQAQATEAMERAVAFALIGIAPETPLAEVSVKPYLKQAKKLLEVAFNAAPQAQADARDAERYRGVRLMMQFEKSGKTGKTVMTLNAPLDADATHDIHEDWMAAKFDASVDRTFDAAIAAAKGE